MNIAQFGLTVSILATRMTGFLLYLVNPITPIKKIGCGLPAGAPIVPDAKHVFATTCCSEPLCNREILLRDLVLYHGLQEGYFLVLPGNGAHIAVDRQGLRLLDTPPFVTWCECCDAVCRAAKQIKYAARPAKGR